MKSWIVALAAAAGVLVFGAQSAVADPLEWAVTPAVLTIDADGEWEAADHVIQEVRHRPGRGRGRGRGRYDFYRRPPHRGYRHPGVFVPAPVYRYPYAYPYHVPPRGGFYFHGPRVGIGIGW